MGMRNIKKILIVMICGLVLSGCGLATTKPTTVEDKIVTRSGEIKTKVGDEYLLQTSDEIVNITSNKINLDNYIKKKIEVTGMFSGSTLYVDEIKEN